MKLFTFHYVSISTDTTNFASQAVNIYIPLCIYFNFIVPLNGVKSNHLHSTMYLFQLEKQLL